MTNTFCGCNSGQLYEECCQPWHRGQPAPTPEALMRSRFCAFRLGLADYLLATWHASTRPPSLGALDAVRWLSLQVLAADTDADDGRVVFEATGLEGGKRLILRETSRFVREHGRWSYLSGDADFSSQSVGRNEACPCGSGRKAKRCCLS